jgi:glycosyltransferase involved in cell wall biosynthesis
LVNNYDIIFFEQLQIKNMVKNHHLAKSISDASWNKFIQPGRANMCLVSIIIPVYNVEKYLHRCLDSAGQQSYPDIEIIIINDGSPDQCQAIIDEYAAQDARIKVIRQENRGLAAARNAGIKMARGDYLMFVDADDYIEADCVQQMLDNALLTEADIVAGNHKILPSHGHALDGIQFTSGVLSRQAMGQVNQRFDYFIGKRYRAAVWAKLFKRDFIRAAGLQFESTSEYFAEDMLFSLKYYVNEPKISLLNKYLYVYCLNEDSITSSYKPNLSQRYVSLVERFRDYLASRGQVEQYQDLLDFISFNVMSVVCNNAYRFSPSRWREIKKEIKYLLQSELIRKMTADFARGDYIQAIDDVKWRLFARCYAWALNNNLIDMAVLMQWVRFKLYK